MGTWYRRLVHLLRLSRHEAELREEIEAHRSLRAAHLEREGLTSRQAADASRRAMGNVLLAREDARDVWLGSWAAWWPDVRYGLRTLRRNPTFTAVAVVTLALGIGVNAGLFSVVNGVLFRSLPAPDAHELVSIAQTTEGAQSTRTTTGAGTFSLSEYQTYRERARTLSGLLAHADAIETALGGETPQEVQGAIVSCNYFDVLRQPAAIGRALTDDDCEPGADPVVVLGHELWTTAFAADPEIPGRIVELDGQPFTVVGVASRGTYGGSPFRIGYFAPLGAEPLLARGLSRVQTDGHRWLYLIGRRSERADLAQVRAELDVIAAQIDRLEPGRTTRLTIALATPWTVSPGARTAAAATAVVLMTAFGLILLIACANVANLLLARGTARTQEIAVRLSLGASRGRLVRQLLTESLLLSLAGGLAGSVLALGSARALLALAVPAMIRPEYSVSIVWDPSPDARVLMFAAAVTAGTSLLFGLAPALQMSRPDVRTAIAQDAAGAGASRRSARLRSALVGIQVTLCMVLMIAAGLLLRGLYATYAIDPGFAYRDVASVSLGLEGARYAPDEAAALRQRLADQIEALPGVDAVVSASRPPLSDERISIAMRLPGRPDSEQLPVRINDVGPAYFSLLEIPILRGRTFTEAEAAAGLQAAAGQAPIVVSETTARTLWPGDDPIGQTLFLGETTLEVVGVAGDAQVSALGAIDPYFAYLPGGGRSLLVKSRIESGALAAAVRTLVRAHDPGLVVRVLPLEANIGWWRGMSGVATTVAASLGALALVLASIGIYGVVAYAVTRRRREIGIRMALGASGRAVLGAILRQTLRPVAAGAAIGLAAAIAVSRILSSVLFGVSPADPIGLGGAALLVLGVALAAALLAAKPAASTDPTVALRYE